MQFFALGLSQPNIKMSVSSNDSTSKYLRNDDGHFVCPTCGVVKEKQNTMYYHMKRHEKELPYSCKHCKKGFLQKQTLDLHIKSKHSGSTSREFECPVDGCDFSSHTKGNCKTHFFRTHCAEEVDELLIHNKEEGTIQCMACDTFFNSLGLFYYHCSKCIGELPEDDPRYDAFRAIMDA